jgi:hypothetical protein
MNHSGYSTYEQLNVILLTRFWGQVKHPTIKILIDAYWKITWDETNTLINIQVRSKINQTIKNEHTTNR